MRQLVAVIALALLTACGSDVVREGRVNVPVTVSNARLLMLSGDSTDEIAMNVQVENTTSDDVYLEVGAFWYRPDSDVPNANAGPTIYTSNESTCPTAPVRPGSSRSCSLVFAWHDMHPIADVAPGTLAFSEAGTWIGGSARVESLD